MINPPISSRFFRSSSVISRYKLTEINTTTAMDDHISIATHPLDPLLRPTRLNYPLKCFGKIYLHILGDFRITYSRFVEIF